MKAKRKHPASLKRISERDMMKQENQLMEGDDKVVVDRWKGMTK